MNLNAQLGNIEAYFFQLLTKNAEVIPTQKSFQTKSILFVHSWQLKLKNVKPYFVLSFNNKPIFTP